MSLSALGSSLPLSSPLRTRQHTSEAGSPTLEQVLLMRPRPDLTRSTTDLGYGSLREPEDLYSCLLTPSLEEEMELVDSGENCSPRPTLQDIVGIDQAVAQAVQNLQSLQQRRVEIYSDLGFRTTSDPVPLPVYQVSPGQCKICYFPPICSPFSDPLTPLTPLLPEDLVLLPKPVPVAAPPPLVPALAAPAAPPEVQSDPLALERAARLYRSAASVCQANCTWSGQLPHRSSTAAPNSSYSTKIFLGGVPWDISEQTLVQVGGGHSATEISPPSFSSRVSQSSGRFGWSGLGETTPPLPRVISTSSSMTRRTSRASWPSAARTSTPGTLTTTR